MRSAGTAFREALAAEQPLQVVGAINAYAALLAEHAGFRAIYVSGAGVANASFGMPDLGITNLGDVVEDVRRITAATPLPVLVDVDTGFGEALAIARTVREMFRAGAAAIHMEDQIAAKRCGHRPGKALVAAQEMVDRLAAALDARPDPGLLVMARTDAIAVEGPDAALERAVAYQEAGADAMFVEGVPDLATVRRFVDALEVPVLVNVTEFGVTPLFSLEELRAAGVALALYPLSAFRAMAGAAEAVYREVRASGTQAAMVERMQTRAELYEHLHYYDYERKLDELFGGRGRA
jgi:methylisocitrate lyase